MQSAFVAKALKLETPKTDVKFNRVVTDSRKVLPGDLFVAILGDQFDGHNFISTALEKGAAGVVFKQGFKIDAKSKFENAIYFEVNDTISAYRSLGHAWRKTFNIPMIAVAGSVGKTTTKELLAAILRGKYKSVHKTLGSQNGFVGIPMTLLELNEKSKASVIEIGIDDIGAMKQHMPVIEPTAAILSAIGPEHLENLKDLKTVAYEESIALRETYKTGGKISINLDDPWIAPLATEFKSGPSYFFSMNPSNRSFQQDRLVYGEFAQDRKSIKISAFQKETFTVELPLLGEHNARNLLGAVCVALSLGLTPPEIESGLKTFEGVSGRSEIRSRDGHTYICDYYNANPTSMKASFEMASSLSPNLPHFACLGDMLELGVDEEKYHRELASQLKMQKWVEVLLFGNRMKWLADELKNSSVRFRHFNSKAELKSALTNNLSSPSVILIKGSRSMKMEEVFAQ